MKNLGISADFEWVKPNFPEGNEMETDEDAIAIEVKIADYKDKLKWGKRIKTWVNSTGGMRGKSTRTSEDSNVADVTRNMIKEHTRAVKNLSINGEVVKTGAELIEMSGVPSDLIAAITSIIMEESVNTEGEEKN